MVIYVYYITFNMTENVLEISVLWQLYIRLIYGMAFECELRYKKTQSTDKLKRYYLLSLLFLM